MLLDCLVPEQVQWRFVGSVGLNLMSRVELLESDLSCFLCFQKNNAMLGHIKTV